MAVPRASRRLRSGPSQRLTGALAFGDDEPSPLFVEQQKPGRRALLNEGGKPWELESWLSDYRKAAAALSGDKDRALTLLEKIAGTPTASPQQLQGDDDLASLRGDPRFARLLSGAR